MLLLNLLLALAWVILTNEYTALNFAIGLLLAYLILRLTQQNERARRYVRRVSLIIKFILFFMGELVVSSLRVAYQVLTSHDRMKPAVVAVPLDVKSDRAITLLGNLITLTPGTLTLDVSTDRTVMYIHTIDMEDEDIEAFRASIKNGFERRIIEVLE